jgi:hypothetical protein
MGLDMTNAATLLDHLRKTIQSKRNFPIGVLTYYGPDDKTITKIVAVVIPARDADPILRRWQSPEVASDPKVAAEIGQYLMGHKVQEVVMAEGVIGCPHEEGIDYPVGESCPNCPFWSKKV